MRQLNDEEIRKIKAPYEGSYEVKAFWEKKRTATAQYQQDLKDFIKWGEEGCPHNLSLEGMSYQLKHECLACWQSLKQLVGGNR